jgi:hypothetical protein
VGLADPVAQGAGLGHAAQDVAQGDAAEQDVVADPEDEEGVTLAQVLVALVERQPSPERRPGQVVGRPGGLPGLKEALAAVAKGGPGLEVAHARGSQAEALGLHRVPGIG